MKAESEVSQNDLNKCQDCGQQRQLLVYTSPEPTICEFCFDKRQESRQTPINQIIPQLYLGSLSGLSAHKLKQYQIHSVCSCLSEPSSFNGVSFETKTIPVRDTADEDIFQHFGEFCDWVQQQIRQQKNVFVHCAAGVSRSASFVIAFLMKSKKLNYKQGIQFVKSKRPCVQPNYGFKKQLVEWETFLQ